MPACARDRVARDASVGDAGGALRAKWSHSDQCDLCLGPVVVLPQIVARFGNFQDMHKRALIWSSTEANEPKRVRYQRNKQLFLKANEYSLFQAKDYLGSPVIDQKYKEAVVMLKSEFQKYVDQQIQFQQQLQQYHGQQTLSQAGRLQQHGPVKKNTQISRFFTAARIAMGEDMEDSRASLDSRQLDDFIGSERLIPDTVNMLQSHSSSLNQQQLQQSMTSSAGNAPMLHQQQQQQQQHQQQKNNFSKRRSMFEVQFSNSLQDYKTRRNSHMVGQPITPLLQQLSFEKFSSEFFDKFAINKQLDKQINKQFSSNQKKKEQENSTKQTHDQAGSLIAQNLHLQIHISSNNTPSSRQDSSVLNNANNRSSHNNASNHTNNTNSVLINRNNLNIFDQMVENSSSYEDNNEEDNQSDFQNIMIVDKDKKWLSDGDVKNFDCDFENNFLKVNLQDFNFIRVLGQGAFGDVWLAKQKSTNDEYAIKIIDCDQNMDEKTIRNLEAENNVFQKVRSDYVVKCVYSFQESGYLFFVMDYMPGGDFQAILKTYGILDEAITKFYIAEVVLAIEYLHENDIVHRDLKPANILLDKAGHIKLADFGLSEVRLSKKLEYQQRQYSEDKNQQDSVNQESPEAENGPSKKSLEGLKIKPQKDGKDIKLELKLNPLHKEYQNLIQQIPQKFNESKPIEKKVIDQRKRVVGTPDYIAPEVLDGNISNKTIDWWSLGIIIYEFIVGVLPFSGSTAKDTFKNIKKGLSVVEWPPIGEGENMMTPECQDLIIQLLNPDHTQRLGNKGAKEIKQHKWFKGIKWSSLRQQEAPLMSEYLEIDPQEQDENKMKREKKFKDVLEVRQRQSSNQFDQQQQDKRRKTVNLGIENIMRKDLLYDIGRKEAEEKIKKHQQKIERWNEKLKKLHQMKEQFQINNLPSTNPLHTSSNGNNNHNGGNNANNNYHSHHHSSHLNNTPSSYHHTKSTNANLIYQPLRVLDFEALQTQNTSTNQPAHK